MLRFKSWQWYASEEPFHPSTPMLSFLLVLLTVIVLAGLWLAYQIYVAPLFSPLRNLPGPEVGKGLFIGGHLGDVQR